MKLSLSPSRWSIALSAITAALLAGSPAWAQNENETVGFRPGHNFESGAFGEEIDILNGGLGLTVPIGPRYQVDARLGYQLNLSYSSKIWDTNDYLNNNVPSNRQVIQRGESPFGIGFTMHMGRIFKDEQQSTDCLHGCVRASWVWVSPDGSQHEFYYEGGGVPPPPGVFNGPDGIYFEPKLTDDLSYYRIWGPKNDYCPITGGADKCFRVEGRNGVVYTLEQQVPCLSAGLPSNPAYSKTRTDNMSFCGWYTTLIEDRTIVRQSGTPEPLYPQRVVVTYEPDTSIGFEHAIANITDATGRSIEFHNCEWGRGFCSSSTNHACNIDDHCPVGETCRSGWACQNSPGTPCNADSDCPGSTCSIQNVETDITNRCVMGVTSASDRSAVATYGIDVPSFGNNSASLTSDKAHYSLMYEYDRIERGDHTQKGLHNLTDAVLKLVRIDYPGYEHVMGGSSDLYSLYYSYGNSDPGLCGWTLASGFTADHGEITCRTLPLLRRAAGEATDQIPGNACEGTGDWPKFKYTYTYYGYRSAYMSGGHTQNKNCHNPSPGTCNAASGGGPGETGQSRQLVRKRLSWSGSESDWLYCRTVSTKTNPEKVTVGDPFGNDTVYKYRASSAAETAQPGGVDADNGLAPEWNDGANYQIEYFEGNATSGRLVRTAAMSQDADRDSNQKRMKGNLRAPLDQTIHRDDGDRTETISRSEWDGQHWGQVTRSGTGISSAATTRLQYGSGVLGSLPGTGGYNVYMPDLVVVEEVSDGATVLRRTDNQYDNARGWLTASVARAVPPMAGTPWSMTQYPGDVKTTLTYSPASGNLVSKTVSGDPADPGVGVAYTWAPTLGACNTLAGYLGRPVTDCGGYLATKSFLNGGTAAWKSIDRDRDANTGLILKTRDSSSVWTSYSYDKLGRVTSVGRQDEDATVVDYASLLETTVRRGDVASGNYEFTRFRYDGLGRNTVQEKRPADSTKTACKTKQLDIDGSVVFTSIWRYDSTCVPGETGESGTITSYRASDAGPRDPLARVRRAIPSDHGADPNTGERITSTEYFGNSSRLTVAGVMGRNGPFSVESEFIHDAFGRLIHVEQPSGRNCSTSGISCQSDNDCLPGVCITDGGTDATYSYDALDRLVGVELTDGYSPIQERLFQYDGIGRQVWAYHPESGLTVNEAFDGLGNVLKVRDAKGTLHRFIYDFAGRLKERRVTPTGGAERLVLRNTYDSTSAGRGASAGKLTTAEHFDEPGAVYFTENFYYVGVGGRLSRVEQRFADWSTPLATNYAYNSQGQVSTVTYPVEASPGHTPLTITYDYYNGYSISVREDVNGRVLGSATYSAAGAVEEINTPGGGNTTITFDTLHRPSRVQISSPNSTNGLDYDSGDYHYDGAGNIYLRSDPASGAAPPFGIYRYDSAQRLISSVTRQNGQEFEEAYTYDTFGNMTEKTLHFGTLYETDVFEIEGSGLSNRVGSRTTTLGTGSGTTGSTVPFQYDPNGNLIQGGRHWFDPLEKRDVKQYVYSPLNYLLRVLKTSNTNSTVSEVDRFMYDASGKRIRKVSSEDGLSTYYLRDGSGQVMSEYRRGVLDGAAAEWSKDYVYFAGKVLSMKENLKPSSPSGLHVSAVMGEFGYLVSLEWEPNPETDVLSYQVFRKIQPASTFTQIGTSGGPGFADPTEHPSGKTIFYYVKAIDSAGYESVISATVKIQTGDTTPPAKPVLTAVAGNGYVHLSWTTVTDLVGIAGYELVRRSNTNNPGIPLSSTLLTNTSFTDVAVLNGSTYYYRVRAIDNSGNVGPFSCPTNPPGGVCDTSAAPKDFTAPIPVHGVSTCEEGHPSIRVTWEPSPSTDHVTAYRVYRNTVPVFAGASPAPTVLGTTTLPEYTVTPPSAGVFYYSVRALDDANPANESWWSVPIAIARDMSAPLEGLEGPIFADGRDGTVVLNWVTMNTPRDRYHIYRRRSGLDRCYSQIATVDAVGGAMMEYVDIVPANNMAYEYIVGGVVGSSIAGTSKPGIGIPLANPTTLFECGEDILDPYDYASDHPARQYTWDQVNARTYHPISATNTGDLPGYLMGYHVNFFRASNNGTGFDDSIMHRVRPIRWAQETDPSDGLPPYEIPGLTLDPVLNEAPKYIANANWDTRFILDGWGYSGAVRAYPPFTLFPDYSSRACVLPKSVYKVFAQGTWLTVESDLPDYFDLTQASPLQRCGRPSADATLDPPTYPIACSDSMWPLPPSNVVATALEPGAVTISWNPSPAGGPAIAGYRVYVSELTSRTLAPPLSGATDPVFLQNAVRQSVPYAVVDPATTSIVVRGINNKKVLGAGSSGMQYQVVAFDAAGRLSGVSGTTTTPPGPGQPGDEETGTAPGVPRSFRSVPWTLNDTIQGHERSRTGIKLAWENAKVPTGRTLVGFRIYRSAVGDSYGCALLTGSPPATLELPEEVEALCATTQAQDNLVTVGASSRYFHDYAVTAGTDYYYRLTQVEQSASGLLETPIVDSEHLVSRQLLFEAGVFPPPQGLMAYAPPASSPGQDQTGIYLKWCAVPYPGAPDSGLPPQSQLEYRVYRSQYVSGIRWWMHHARVKPECLQANSRCEITSANKCSNSTWWSWDNCPIIAPPACGGAGQPACCGSVGAPPCSGIVDKVIDSYPAASDPYGTQIQKNFVYRVSASGGTDASESAPSQPDEAWPNYCDGPGDTSCGDRMDPEGKTGPLVCGDENARLQVTPAAEHIRTDASAESTAPYRIVGQPVCLDCEGGGANPYSPPSKFAFFHTDHLGTPRVLYDGGGNLLEKHDPLPFGDERGPTSSTTSNTKVFTGHERDSETGLDYMLARYHSSSLGRFLAPDPIHSMYKSIPQSWNAYSYSLNNPVKYVDPSGLRPETAARTENSLAKAREILEQMLGMECDAECQKTGAEADAAEAEKDDDDGDDDEDDDDKDDDDDDGEDGEDGDDKPSKGIARAPDYLAVSLNLGSALGWSGQIAIDDYGNVYFAILGYTAGRSATGVSGSIVVGWLNTLINPTESQMQEYLTGANWTVGGGYYGVGANLGYTPGAPTSTATEIGIFSPQIGVSYHYSMTP